MYVACHELQLSCRVVTSSSRNPMTEEEEKKKKHLLLSLFFFSTPFLLHHHRRLVHPEVAKMPPTNTNKLEREEKKVRVARSGVRSK